MSYRTFSLNSLGIYLYLVAAVCLAQPELPRLRETGLLLGGRIARCLMEGAL